MKPISTYCKQEVPGWELLPEKMLFCEEGKEAFSCSFINKDEGIQFLASVKESDQGDYILASIGQLSFLRRDLTRDQLAKNIDALTPIILKSFFGNRGFAEQEKLSKSTIKHHVSMV